MKKRKALRIDKIMEFLKEDIGYGDITSESLLKEGQRAHAKLYTKENGIIAGLNEAMTLFSFLGCDIKFLMEDGSKVEAGETFMEIEGDAKSILRGERTALNLIGRMSGIATAVAKAINEAKKANPRIKVAATRKTAPGLRNFDKRSVELGGGDTHRFRLDDCVLIKDNHLMFGFSIADAVERTRERVSFTKKIEVEVRSLEEAKEALYAGAEMVMFDNMAPEEIKSNLKAINNEGLRKGRIFEASGGITMNNIKGFAESGVDIISMGSLTHSVRNLDVKLKVEPMGEECI